MKLWYKLLCLFGKHNIDAQVHVGVYNIEISWYGVCNHCGRFFSSLDK